MIRGFLLDLEVRRRVGDALGRLRVDDDHVNEVRAGLEPLDRDRGREGRLAACCRGQEIISISPKAVG